MELLRSRLPAALIAGVLALSLTACGDDDGKGATEDIEKGVKKGTNKIEKEGRELEDDAKGRDERKQKD
jgi:hypothetical protein